MCMKAGKTRVRCWKCQVQGSKDRVEKKDAKELTCNFFSLMAKADTLC